MSLDRPALAAALSAHGPLVRVLVAEHAGSAPREAGTAMLVAQDALIGTIGGGALEHDAIARARASLRDGPRAQVLRRPLGPALGQCCGGAVTLVLERLTPEDLDAIPSGGLYARPVAADAPAEVPLSVARALRAARAGLPPAPILAGGWLAEPVAAPHPPVWIWGAGHVGRALVDTLEGLPFAVTWIDDARGRFPDRIPPHADMLVADPPPRAAAHAPAEAHHLVLTYSHALDLEICHHVLSRPFGRLGLIGSATKRARFLKRLAALGHPAERLARLQCPIGDRALGKEPRAIAVGVVHGLLRDRAAADSGRDETAREGSAG